MPETKKLAVKDISLDLKNFRNLPQKSEKAAVEALITLKPEWFWALMESLIQNGYSPTENIIVLKEGKKQVVKEGNRRIAALKIIHGLVKGIDVPDAIATSIKGLQPAWKTENAEVPCAVYSSKEADAADEVVARTHGYNEKAGRLKWESVARARHSRDFGDNSEPALDLLEEYIKYGKNATQTQKDIWAGEYPVSVLDEAIKKLAPCVGFKSAADLVSAYPKNNATKIDSVVLAIGEETLGFKHMRAETPFWGERFGFSKPQPQTTTSGAATTSNATGTSTTATSSQSGQPGSTQTGGGTSGTGQTRSTAPAAHASNEPKSVIKKLKDFKVRGKGREKIELLRKEIVTLKIDKQPHSFCLLLRCLFELSAKAYCTDHKASGGPKLKDKNGNDRHLVDVLREITDHLTSNRQDKAMVNLLHGPMSELARPQGLLSITSLNQLIHNPSFSIAPGDICILFFNVFPLLDAMNGK